MYHQLSLQLEQRPAVPYPLVLRPIGRLEFFQVCVCVRPVGIPGQSCLQGNALHNVQHHIPAPCVAAQPHSLALLELSLQKPQPFNVMAFIKTPYGIMISEYVWILHPCVHRSCVRPDGLQRRFAV